MFLDVAAHYDPNYTKKTEEVCKVLEAQPIQSVLRVDEFAAAVDFDPLGCIRVLVRHGYFKSVSSPRKKVQGYQRGPNWPPPESFLESGPAGFTYFVTKWFGTSRCSFWIFMSRLLSSRDPRSRPRH